MDSLYAQDHLMSYSPGRQYYCPLQCVSGEKDTKLTVIGGPVLPIPLEPGWSSVVNLEPMKGPSMFPLCLAK